MTKVTKPIAGVSEEQTPIEKLASMIAAQRAFKEEGNSADLSGGKIFVPMGLSTEKKEFLPKVRYEEEATTAIVSSKARRIVAGVKHITNNSSEYVSGLINLFNRLEPSKNAYLKDIEYNCNHTFIKDGKVFSS